MKTQMTSSDETQENPEMEAQDGSEKTDFNEDNSSPRGVLENPVLGTESDSSSSCDSPPSPTDNLIAHQTVVPESNGLQWKKNFFESIHPKRFFFDTIKKKPGRSIVTIPMAATSKASRRILSRSLAGIRGNEERPKYDGPFVAKPSWRNFGYDELAAATDRFSSEKLIGQGGQAEVYKGFLSDGQVVAVKKVIRSEKGEEEKVADFLSELGIIAHVNHPNAARLLGFSLEQGLHLVLDYSPHGSLASLLHGGSKEPLEWRIRFKVAIGVAEGLQYLHHGCTRRIIHRDIKASNILLTQDYEPQISDFGLAKWLPEQWGHHVVFPIEGTFGYLAPEYFMHGIVDEKTDVFAFGVLLLEIITGRHALETCGQNLVMWAKPLIDANNLKELVDPCLGHGYDIVEMKRMILTASRCIHHSSTMRPNMSQALQLLRGEDGAMEVTGRETKPLLLDGCDLDDYTSSNYRSDLNRHMQLVLE